MSRSGFLDQLATLAPERANAILRDAFGPAGISVSPARLAWECAGSVRLGAAFANSPSGDRSARGRAADRVLALR